MGMWMPRPYRREDLDWICGRRGSLAVGLVDGGGIGGGGGYGRTWEGGGGLQCSLKNKKALSKTTPAQYPQANAFPPDIEF
jgi:hypothetical protein